MGLSISHNAFSAPYSTFNRWRTEIAKRIGMPLDLMEGFYFEKEQNPFTLLNYAYPKGDELEMANLRRSLIPLLPLKWDSFKPSPLHDLLYHSDCDGYINYSSLRKIIPILESMIKDDDKESGFYQTTDQFINGAKDAVNHKQRLEFR